MNRPDPDTYRHREITRPDVRWRSAAVRFLLIFGAAAAIAWLAARHAMPGMLAFEIAVAAIFAATARSNVILAVRLYQRYAPDHVRRRCMMLPTCSDYAILAVGRHGAVRGIIMTCRRLRHRCDGTFKIDYPL